MLFERPIFQQALLNPTVLSLASYMIGRKCIVRRLGLLETDDVRLRFPEPRARGIEPSGETELFSSPA